MTMNDKKPNSKSGGALQDEVERHERAEATQAHYQLLNKTDLRPVDERLRRRDGAEAARLHYRLLNRDDLRERGIRFSRAHLHRLILAGKFPSPIKLGENRNAWVESEISNWIAARIAERDAERAA
jgi:prophage regulatory protein